MKFIHNISIFVLFLAFGGIFYIGFQLLWPYNPLEFTDPSFTVLNENKELHVGETLRYLVRYCKHTTKSSEVSYQLINSVIYFSTVNAQGNAPKGCGEHVNQFVIPEINSEGDYRLVMLVKYQMSLIRTVTVQGATEVFRIVK